MLGPQGGTATARAARIAGTYAGVAIAYIVVSDRLILLAGTAAAVSLQTYKGFAFIATTALLLFGLLRAMFQHLEESNARLYLTQFANDNAADAICWFDAAGRIVYLNHAAAALLGASPEQAMCLTLFDLDPDLTPERSLARWGRLRTEKVLRFEARLRLLDGSVIPVDVAANYVQYDGEQLNVSYMRDISDRKAAEARLLESQTIMRTFVDALPGFASIQSPDLRYVLVSRRVCEGLGLDERDILGKSPAELYDPETAERVMNEDRAVLALRGQVVATESTAEVHGEQITVALQKAAVRDAAGDVTGLVTLGVDITERKRVEQVLHSTNEALRRANADLEQFAYAAAHDLREPLRNVALHAQMLRRAKVHETSAQAARALDYIVEGVHRMEALVRDLLTFAEVTREVDASGLETDSRAVFDETLEALEPSIREAHAEIEIGPLPRLPVAPVHLRQLLQNLVGNAIKYREPSRPLKVSISADVRDGVAVFHVRDNGIGIKPEYFDRVFGVFKRLHGRHIPGTGIGLALCRRVVESYAGRIWVESDFGAGSTFHFTLPVRPDAKGPAYS